MQHRHKQVLIFTVALVTIAVAWIAFVRLQRPAMTPVMQRDRLHEAVASGDVAQVKRLLRWGANPDATNYDGETALHIAARHDQPEAITALIRGHATVDIVGGPKHRTPLEVAFHEDHPACLTRLLDAGAAAHRLADGNFSALHQAARHGLPGCLAALLDRGEPMEGVDRNGDTPLGMAARHNQVACAKLLMARGANINHVATSFLGDTPLMQAAASQSLEVAALLLEAGAAVNAADSMGHSALADAVRTGSIPMVELLLEHGANPRQEDDNGRSPLELARNRRARRDVFKILEAHVAVPDAMAAMPKSLHEAMAKDHLDGARALLAAGHDPDEADTRGRTPLHLARNATMAKLLLDAGAKIEAADAEGMTPLMTAVDADRLEVARTLLEAGADVQARDHDQYTALLHVPIGTGLPLAKLLLEYGADAAAAGRHGHTALNFAAAGNNVPLIDLLIEHGAPVNGAPGGGHTPLHSLMYRSGLNLATVKALLAHKPDLSIRDSHGMTVMAHAIGGTKAELAPLLLDAGAPLDIYCATAIGDIESVRSFLDRDPTLLESSMPGEWGLPALHIAARRNNVEIVTLLLERGATVDMEITSGDTPLHSAAYWGAMDVMRLLIARGADLYHRNRDGATPLMFAARWGRTDAVRVLLEHGAAPNLAYDVLRYTRITPLHMAARQNEVATCAVLLEAGADPNLPDGQGVTAAEIASRSKSAKLRKLFE